VTIGRQAIRQRWRLFGANLDERGRLHFAAVEARTAGYGGIVAFKCLLRQRMNRATAVRPRYLKTGPRLAY
jgi:hypothetical protein